VEAREIKHGTQEFLNVLLLGLIGAHEGMELVVPALEYYGIGGWLEETSTNRPFAHGSNTGPEEAKDGILEPRCDNLELRQGVVSQAHGGRWGPHFVLVQALEGRWQMLLHKQEQVA
jgi:hypothetical protein